MSPSFRLPACTALVALAALIGPPAARSQLPSMTAPRGTMRIELRGDFAPVSDAWVNGTKRPLGSLIVGNTALDGASSPLVAEVDQRLSAILGTPQSGASLGSVSSIAEWQRGVGTIGLALGLTPRITLYGNLPIVSVRTQVGFAFDPAGATLGLNPADPVLGNSSGVNQTANFFAGFDAALSDLSTRLANGDYSADPTQQALAQQTLAAATTVRGQLFELLADPALSSPLLPTSSSPAGAALLERVTQLGGAFGTLGVSFTGTPALPSAVVGANDFEALLDAPTAYGFTPRNVAPRVALGDIELGAVFAAVQHRGPQSALGVWIRGGVRLPTGEAPVPTTLLAQGSGDHLLDVEAAATIEASRGRLGVRAEATFTKQLAGDVQTRIGDPLQALLPTRFLAAVRRDPGDIVALTVQPFFRLASRLAITGLVQHMSRGADEVTLAGAQPTVPGADPSSLARNTKASATRIGAGLSYMHDGVGRDGVARMPVEASLAVERTIASGSGVVPAALTSRVMFRVYKRVW